MFFRLPIIGYALRCIDEERPFELALLALNLVMFVAVVAFTFGYPGFITVILALMVVIALSILASTVG